MAVRRYDLADLHRETSRSRSCARRPGVGAGRRGGFRGVGGGLGDLIRIDNAVALNGGEAFGTNGGMDWAEAAAAAAFLPTVTLTAWCRFRINVNRHSRGLIGQWDYGSARRWQVTTNFSVGQERRLTMFFGQVGTDTTAWSLTGSADVLPVVGDDVTIFVALKMDEATAGDRAKVYVYDHAAGTLTGPIAWGAPGGTPATSLPSTSTKLTVGAWNSRPGVSGATCYARAWGFHDVVLTTDEMTAIARDRRRVTRGEIDLFEPTHGYDATFAARRGTIVTAKPDATRPVRIRLSAFPPLARCTLVGLTAGATPTRMQAGAAGRQHHGVSGQKIGDGTAPISGSMNNTATADAALYDPDVILFEGGTNDIMSAVGETQVTGAVALARAQDFIRKVTAADLTRQVFWGTLTRTRDTTAHPVSGTYQSQVDAFNTGIDAAITTLQGEGIDVVKVVLHDKLTITDDFADATHPGAAGYHKLGARGWWDSVKSDLPAGAYRMWLRGDSLILGSGYNESGAANDGGPRVELVAHMAEAGH